MRKRSLTARLLATAISILIVFVGLWVGRHVLDRLKLPVGINWPSVPSLGRPSSEPANSKEAEKIYLAFGNPSNAKADGSNRDNYLIVTDAYALSYNNSKGTPNWVAWRITENDLGNLERQNDFLPDESLPPGWKEVTPSDYTGSGYDRGHLCPSGDRSNDPDMNSLTFLMTNIAPQMGDLNRYPWERLESYARGLVRRGHVELYVVAGVYGEKEKIKGKIAVPTNFWKIMIALPQGGSITDVNEKSHIIAVDMPNVEGISQKDWRSYRTSVRAIEQRTSYNFFSTLPQKLQDVIKMRTRD